MVPDAVVLPDADPVRVADADAGAAVTTDASGSRPGPLAGLVVVDFSRVLAGPFATMLMADLGARVIKVERVGDGDDSRGYGPFLDGRSLYFARVNRGKESMALDLKEPADRALALAMALRADVVVENFRPGVMERLGLGPTTLLAQRPSLVVASISGFGQTGPWSQRPAYDTVVQGSSGLMSITGAPDGPPTKPGMPIADLSAGLYAFGAILAAVRGVQVTGRGTHIDLAMHDATVSLLEGAALAYLATGSPPPRIGNAHYAIAPFDTFQCADRPIIICAANDALFGVLALAVGAPELVSMAEFVDNRSRHEHRDALKVLLESALAARTGDAWLDLLSAAGVPSGPVSGVAEAMDSEQLQVRNMVVTAGGLPMPGSPIKMSGYDDPAERPPAPALDEHGAALRAEFGGATVMAAAELAERGR